MVVFLFNSVIFVSLLLCLCILIACLCIFIVMYVLYSVSLCCFVYCLCVNVYLQLPPGLNPTAVNKIYQYIITGSYWKPNCNTLSALYGVCVAWFRKPRGLLFSSNFNFWNKFKPSSMSLAPFFFYFPRIYPCDEVWTRRNSSYIANILLGRRPCLTFWRLTTYI